MSNATASGLAKRPPASGPAGEVARSMRPICKARAAVVVAKRQQELEAVHPGGAPRAPLDGADRLILLYTPRGHGGGGLRLVNVAR